MGDVITLPKPTIPDDDSEIDMPPCGREWPGHANGAAHRCWTWTARPHICRCTRCEVGRRV